MGYSPWGCKELDTTEQLTLSLSFFSHIVNASMCHHYFISSLLITKCYSIVWMVHLVFTHLPVDGYLDCFQFLALLGNATTHLHSSFRAGVCFHVS